MVLSQNEKVFLKCLTPLLQLPAGCMQPAERFDAGSGIRQPNMFGDKLHPVANASHHQHFQGIPLKASSVLAGSGCGWEGAAHLDLRR